MTPDVGEVSSDKALSFAICGQEEKTVRKERYKEYVILPSLRIKEASCNHFHRISFYMHAMVGLEVGLTRIQKPLVRQTDSALVWQSFTVYRHLVILLFVQ